MGFAVVGQEEKEAFKERPMKMLIAATAAAMTLTASLVVLPTLVRLAARRRSPAAVPSISLVIPGSNGVSRPRHSAARDDVGGQGAAQPARGSSAVSRS